MKEFIPHGLVERSDLLLAELTAWEIYQNAGQEARVMYRLNHQNILQLLGVTLAPLRLLLELAPLGDLKACVQKFQQAKVKLSRATLQSTMIQVGFIRNWLFMTCIVCFHRLQKHSTTSIIRVSSLETSNQEMFWSGSSLFRRLSGLGTRWSN